MPEIDIYINYLHHHSNSKLLRRNSQKAMHVYQRDMINRLEIDQSEERNFRKINLLLPAIDPRLLLLDERTKRKSISSSTHFKRYRHTLPWLSLRLTPFSIGRGGRTRRGSRWTNIRRVSEPHSSPNTSLRSEFRKRVGRLIYSSNPLPDLLPSLVRGRR